MFFIDKFLSLKSDDEEILRYEKVISDILNEKSIKKEIFDQFFLKCKNNGAEFENLHLKFYSENHRGLIATRDFKKGEVVLFIPDNLIISESQILDRPMNKFIMGNSKLLENLNSVKHVLGQIWLTEARNGAFPELVDFLKILPDDVSEFPLMFGETEKSMLEGSPILSII